MAARLNLRQQEQTRSAIQTSQLINRLQDFALGKKQVDLDASRLKAIEILLRKSLPDLSSVTISGDGDSPLVHRIERHIVKPNTVDPNG